MKSFSPRLLALLSAATFLSLAVARADDTASPPPPAPAGNATTPADGAPAGRHRGRPGFILADLTAKLGLTADQQKSVGNILADAREQGQQLRDDDSLTRQAKRQKLRQIMNATRTQIRAVLTPDQQKTFDALPINSGAQPPPAAPSSQESQPAPGGQGGQDAPPPPPPNSN